MSRILKWLCDFEEPLMGPLISIISKFLSNTQVPLWCLLTFCFVHDMPSYQLVADSRWLKRTILG